MVRYVVDGLAIDIEQPLYLPKGFPFPIGAADIPHVLVAKVFQFTGSFAGHFTGTNMLLLALVYISDPVTCNLRLFLLPMYIYVTSH